MFNRSQTNDDEPNDLQELITNHISAMAGMNEGSEEYTAAAQSLKTLMDARKIENEIEIPWRPSADAVTAAGASILGIIIITTFEKWNVVTSKAISFVPKTR